MGGYEQEAAKGLCRRLFLIGQVLLTKGDI
jgi:hypothetical protein